MKKTAKLQIAAGILHLLISAGMIVYGVRLFIDIRSYDFTYWGFALFFAMPFILLGYLFAVIAIIIGTIISTQAVRLLVIGQFDDRYRIGEALLRLHKALIPLFILALFISYIISSTFTVAMGIIVAIIFALFVAFGLLIAIRKLEAPFRDYNVKRKK